jgi:hypothetical protein
MIPVLLFVIGALLLILWLSAPRAVPWANELVRLNPGAGDRAEWMAPPEVVRAVKRDYLATQSWLAECSNSWGLLAAELDRHAAGAYHQRQRLALAQLVQSPGPRLSAAITASHRLGVRHFSSDGLHCLVIDHQSERRVTTTGYWTGRVIHRQRLPDGALVYRMVFDPKEGHWLIERLVQRLPAAPGTSAVAVAVAAALPAVSGRDN